MKKLTIKLEHCYGIKRLETEFDFSSARSYAIYAPNGMMKSSFAQTFKDIASDQPSRDRVFPDRVTRREVASEDGKPLTPEAVLVLPPYDEVFGDSKKTATLLVDAALRQEYEQLYRDIEQAKGAFLKAMKQQSKSRRKDLEAEISRTFTDSDDDFYQALAKVQDEVDELPEPQFANVPYNLVADEKVANFLESKDVKQVLKEYIDKYNELLAQSKYLRKGTFDFYNASTIAKSLAKNGFFKAQHTVILNADDKVEVTDEKELASVITQEKEQILKDKELRKAFNEMEKRITRNEMLRDFQEFIADHEEVLALMGNLPKLKEDVWKSYFKEHESLYKDLLSKYRDAQARSSEIEAVALRQRTQWEKVVDIFNRRFFVPFELKVTNKASVVLGDAMAPSLSFTFREGDSRAEIERAALLQVLSSGEKKALYILNVIFEVEVRRHSQTETVFVVDDIADSFDYKNKYAIIQYLKEIAEEEAFRVIVLTHNFDFFRTVNSRFVRYSHCRMVQRTSTGIELIQAVGVKNIFVNDWKKSFFTDARKRVGAISFMRNIVEYTRGDQDTDYDVLTALLHWKAESQMITHGDLDGIYNRLFADGGGSWHDSNEFVVDTIWREARSCLSAPSGGTNFENKIVLAIATRLAAERHMVAKIDDADFVAAIDANQTPRLLDRYRMTPAVSDEDLSTLDEVVLMTPENIHLNSFMYEPIIDMSDNHLRDLYKRVSRL